MAKITLSNGMTALVDDEDLPLVENIRWHPRYKHRVTYAVCREFIEVNGEKKLRLVSMHRIIMGRDAPPIDHANNNGLDNRRCNLRHCNQHQNCGNARKRIGETSSRFKGVCWDKRRNLWIAHITINRAFKQLGRFDHEEDAARAYDKAAQAAFGKFARVNFSDAAQHALPLDI